jgi:hypothetical protein
VETVISILHLAAAMELEKAALPVRLMKKKVTPSQRLVRTRKQSKSRAERLLVLLSETVAPARCRDEWRALGLDDLQAAAGTSYA